MSFQIKQLDPDRVRSNLFGAPLREKFPIFAHSLQQYGKPLCFLDSAASSQKPIEVIERVRKYLSFEHSNVHRGAYELSAAATEAYEAARVVSAKFIAAKSSQNIIFTKGATEAINLAVLSLQDFFKEGDSILVTLLEHHSNIVPWQILAKRKKLNLNFVEISDSGSIDLEDYRTKVLQTKPKVVAFTMLANAIGTATAVAEMTEIAKAAGALVLLDAAQYAAHQAIDVESLGCDFLAFSSHKLYGPTGAGLLYASDRALSHMEPVYGGGDMITSVSTVKSEWAEAPQKFEAGTPAIAEILGMATALEFLGELIAGGLASYEENIFEVFFEALNKEAGVELYGPRTQSNSRHSQTSIITFNIKDVHPHDFATIADQFNVQIRAGHHCAQPLLNRLGLQSTARVSFAAYSDTDQLEPLLESIRHARKVFG